MSSSNSAAAAQYITAYQEEATINVLAIVATVLLLYDTLLTSGQECRYIWRSGTSWVSRLLYVWNRYMSPLYLSLNLGTIPSISDASCTSLIWLTNVLQILNLIGPAMFTTLRIYALSRKNRILGGVALVLSMVPFVINTSTAYQELPIDLSAPLNCAQTNTASRNLNIGLTIASRGSLIAVDSLAIVVTWLQTRAAIQLRTGAMKRPSLEQVMWENGTLYFIPLVSMNVVDMVFVILSMAIAPGDVASYVVFFVDPMTSALNSRFLLALHEMKARLEGVADSSISSFSLNTGSGDNPREGSPELPDFLGIIGSSIRSIHDDDEDLQSLEFAPPQLEEHHSEPEEEVLESGTDGDLV